MSLRFGTVDAVYAMCAGEARLKLKVPSIDSPKRPSKRRDRRQKAKAKSHK